MGTRSEIIIKDYWIDKKTGKTKGFKVKLYHHYDSYPEGVGKDLMELVYPMLIRSNNTDCDTVANKLLKNEEDKGYELTVYKHVDIEYLYEIDIPAKKISCFKCHYSSWDSPTNRIIKDKEIDLSEFLPKGITASYA